MSAPPKDKGKKFERYVAKRLREATPGSNARRGIQTRDGDEEAADVVHPVFHPECKHRKAQSALVALKEAMAHCPEGKYPIAVVRIDRQPTTVTMQLDDFLDLVGEWWELSRR